MATNACVQQHDDYFDAVEELSSESDSLSDDSEGSTFELQQVHTNQEFHSSHYDFWCGNPKSIDERRDDFIRKTGFVLDRCQTAREGPDETNNEHGDGNDLSGNNSHEVSVNEDFQNLLLRIQRLDDGRRRRSLDNVDEVEDDDDDEGMHRKVDEVGSSKVYESDEFQETFGSSSTLMQHFMRESADDIAQQCKRKDECKELGWLKRLSFKAANMFHNNKDKENKETFHNSRKLFGSRSPRVRVHSHKKWSKELSSLYHKQEFPAHKGSILCMKFSHDGQYLATGGEDGILKVWNIVEEERMTDLDLLSFSVISAGLNVSVNGIPKLASLLRFKEEARVMNKVKKSGDSGGDGIMVPRKVFRIVETPCHEFYGHEGEIPDISWSKNGRLLSSSVDNTVRLWKVGRNKCIRVFPHNDFVTCAQFNPVDDNYFISGSIDGKVRVWDVRRCQVLDWIDIKEIVTAICYRPDGKGGIVGSMVGNCSFFDITGSVPLIDRGSQVFASFTADGKHIISATDDSNVYIWNYVNNERARNRKSKNLWSFESFLSPNALIALPWHGITSTSTLPSTTTRHPSTPRHTPESSAPRGNYRSVSHANGVPSQRHTQESSLPRGNYRSVIHDDGVPLPRHTHESFVQKSNYHSVSHDDEVPLPKHTQESSIQRSNYRSVSHYGGLPSARNTRESSIPRGNYRSVSHVDRVPLPRLSIPRGYYRSVSHVDRVSSSRNTQESYDPRGDYHSVSHDDGMPSQRHNQESPVPWGNYRSVSHVDKAPSTKSTKESSVPRENYRSASHDNGVRSPQHTQESDVPRGNYRSVNHVERAPLPRNTQESSVPRGYYRSMSHVDRAPLTRNTKESFVPMENYHSVSHDDGVRSPQHTHKSPVPRGNYRSVSHVDRVPSPRNTHESSVPWGSYRTVSHTDRVPSPRHTEESSVPRGKYRSLSHDDGVPSPGHTPESSVPRGNFRSVSHDGVPSTALSPAMGDVDYEFLRNVCESILSGSHMWGLVIVTGGKDGHIRTYHNYGLPVRYPTGKSLKSSFSLSNIRNRCRENCGNSVSSSSFSR
ncbi:hypothetical protein SOVF_148630 [Spinacia oleracea]|nr:hypothetical protein SOVF_148630 [Spinacia oleracea]